MLISLRNRFLGVRSGISGRYAVRIMNLENSSERSGFLRFYVYLCHMSDILYLSFYHCNYQLKYRKSCANTNI